NTRDATTKAALTGTKQDPAAVMEPDLLIARTREHLPDMRLHLRPVSEPLQRQERLTRRAHMMRRPDHQKARIIHTQRERQRRNKVRLPNLPRQRHAHAINSRSKRTIRPLRQNQPASLPLPRIKRDPHLLP